MKDRKVVKCEGRFPDLRNFLYNEAIPIVMEDETRITSEKLDDLWTLTEEQIHNFDFKDPYFDSRVDPLRKHPLKGPRSLLPLFESPAYNPDLELVKTYLERDMGNNSKVSNLFAKLVDHPREFMRRILEREPNKVILLGGKNLAGYFVSGNFGIGTIVQGGTKGGGVRSDSPFLLEVYQHNRKARGEFNLAALIGFWVQDNNILISQMQPCRNGRVPEGVPFGVSCLQIAEVVGRESGCEKILSYSARAHPIFKEHPDSWKQLSKDFVCIWDNSAKKLGYDGSRNTHYEKRL